MANRKDAERQVDELQTLVAALNAQIQGMQVQLDVREKELREYANRVDEYRAKESAIVFAMTDTQEICAKRLAEADKQAKYITSSAEEKARQTKVEAQFRVREAEDKARLIENDAKLTAEKIIADAKLEAASCLEKAERETETFSSRLNGFKLALEEASKRAQGYAETFEKALYEVSEQADALRKENKELESLLAGRLYEEKSRIEESKDASGYFSGAPGNTGGKGKTESMTDTEAIGEPQATQGYDNASQFMHGMYKLEGRDIPERVEEPPSSKSFFDQFMVDGKSETPATSAPAAERMDDAPSAKSFFDQFMADNKPEPAAPAPAPTAFEPARDEERVWTVDEIISQKRSEPDQQAAPPNVFETPKGGDDLDIDSLLDELMD